MKVFLIVYENTAWGTEYADAFLSLETALADVTTKTSGSRVWVQDGYRWTMGRDTIRIDTFDVEDPSTEYIYVVMEKHTSGYSKILETSDSAVKAEEWLDHTVKSGSWKQGDASSQMTSDSWHQVSPQLWQSGNMSVTIENLKIKR